jgi:heat-inducible transcriptional repressor
MGLLEKPHSSSGRLPTDLGFRYYVDRLMESRNTEYDEESSFARFFCNDGISMQNMVDKMASALSDFSRQVGIIMVPESGRAKLKALYFRYDGKTRIKIIFEFLDGTVEIKSILNEWDLDKSQLTRLSNLINKTVHGLTLFGLRRKLISQLNEARQKADRLFLQAVELSEKILGTDGYEIHIKGQANLLDLPEFSDIEIVQGLVKTFEERKMIISMLEQATLVEGTRVIIGEENTVGSLQGCSLITRSCMTGEYTHGCIGLIGPTRMDYKRLIPLVNYMGDMISGSGKIEHCQS